MTRPCSALLLSLFAGLLAMPLRAQSPEANKTAVRAFTDALNSRAFDRLDTLVKADVVRHSPATPDVQVHNRQELIALFQADAEVFPDGRIELHRLVADDDEVAAWATYHATQEGPMPAPQGTLPATGRTMAMPFSSIFRFEDGQIAELWVIWDNLTVLTQLGHFPPGGETGDPEAARAELLAADRAWAAAAEAGDVERVLTYWADDVVVYLDGRPVVRGHGAMESVVRGNRALPEYSMRREALEGEVAASGDLGYTTGTFEMTLPGSGSEPVVRAGDYVCVWEKQADGSWKTIVQASHTHGGSTAAVD